MGDIYLYLMVACMSELKCVLSDMCITFGLANQLTIVNLSTESAIYCESVRASLDARSTQDYQELSHFTCV
jgi:hypothetical protein